MSRLFLNKSFNRNGKKANNAPANNNTIYEEENPSEDRNRMNNTVCGAPIKSPCPKFQRNNSNPFPETVTCAAPVQETPKKIDDSRQQKSLGKFLKYIRPNSRKKKNPPVLTDSPFKVNENSSTVPSDELNTLNTSSNASPLRVMSQVYETSINKHGDVVEYAVPYSEIQSPIINDSVSSRGEGLTDENALNESKWSDRVVDLSGLGIVKSPVKITDLDKSSDGYRSLLDQSGKGIADSSNKDMLSELDSLERWSQNIPQRSLPAHEPPIDTNVHVIKCKPREIKPKRGVLRNTISLPLHFSSGYFRKTPVAVRKCCPRDSVSVGLVEEAIERDYDILNKVKHSNIILLMAASFHRKSFDHMTLVLEPVDYTLNYFLHHQMDTTLSIVDSISIVQQIASAALYMQECGYIHSNISSHNILVRESPWCVKLSSFELTTEVDFADTRIELMIEYRHQKLKSFNNRCTDTPKYAAVEDESVSLRDQYRQMSKMLPILKCSPHSKHKYLSMLSKHLIYDTNYRQHLSLHNFQAPELLTTKRQFVFPTTQADVYSLCLLLWEMLNNCVPFVVYSKLDMERMIQSNKLSLPFFERARCEPFMDIFRIGLALNPEDRTIDVQQLINRLEEIKFRIRSGARDLGKEKRRDTDQVNLCVNTAVDDCQKNDSSSTCSALSPNSTDFNHRLHENEVTSTKKKKRKSPQKFIKKNTFRQLFNHNKETVTSGACESIFTHAQLNENLDAIASEIRREQSLDEIAEESERSNFSSVVAPLSSEENEFPSKISVQKPPGEHDSSSDNVEWRKTSPEIVADFEIGDENHCANSKSCSNLFDTSTSESRGRSFHSNIVSPSGFNVGEYSLPDTPIARKNKIRRNAWLSNKSLNLSNKDVEELATDQSERLNDSNQLNVSIRIVHSKVTPKKVDSENPLVKSRIRFFDANTETASSVTLPTSNTKISNNDRVEEIDSNYSANYPIKASSAKELVDMAHDTRNSLPGSSTHLSTSRGTERTLSNCSTLPMSHKKYGDSKNPPSSADQRSSSFDNKFWKGELDTCNRSEGSDDTDEDGNVITPKWRSVRDKILKFEKRGVLATTSSPLKTATEFVRNLSKSVTTTQSNGKKSTEVPTLIKRTIYSESIVSGVDLASLDTQMPLFDQLNLGGRKRTTQVTLNMRQIRRRSSDLDEVDRPKIEGIAEICHTICGSQKGLLSFNTQAPQDGSSGGKTKYICTECTTKMSPDELRELTLESVAESPLHATAVTDHSLPLPITNCQRTPQRRCQVRVKSQDTRSIEDLYIDDDFDQGLGLGANIELQSDSSDFLNFDLITDIFNKSKVDT